MLLLITILFVAILCYRGFLRWIEYKENRHVRVNRAAVEVMVGGEDELSPSEVDNEVLRAMSGPPSSQNVGLDDEGFIVNEEGS